jgi:formylglycine-generating enzyme required for sulfatase activity
MDRRTILLGSLGLVLPASTAESSQPQQSNQKRFALILANESYDNKALTNILNDARSMSRTLEQLGFNVTSGLDQTRSGMFSALRTFRDKLTPGCIALVYYSGHGAQVGGENYLIPVNNAGLEKASDLPDEAMPLGRILDALGKSDGQLNLIILDACRDNPFPGAKSLGGDKGLAVVSRNVSGTLIAFAASPGEVASANPSGKNSLFTEELVKNLPKSGLRLEDVFLNTRKAVRERSGGKQIPQEYGSLESVVFLAGGSATSPIGNTNSEIKLSPTAIRLELIGLPAGAKVLIDDVVLSGTIYTDEIAEKTKEVEISVSASGFRPYVGRVTLTRGASSRLNIELAPKSHTSQTNAIPLRFIRLSNYPALNMYVKSMCSIPGGTFEMGSVSGWYANEAPKHFVKLSSFHLGKTPVTVAIWKEYCSAIGRPIREAPPWKWLDDHPIVNVNWIDLLGTSKWLGFCTWASDVSGVDLTLPTEAQFEYASRGGQNGVAFPWGNKFDQRKLWCAESRTSDPGKTAPVFRSTRIHRNPYGLTDMSGNVWQWCSDWYAPYSSHSQTNPVGPDLSTKECRCARGGSWSDYEPNVFRCAKRGLLDPTYGYLTIGFRLAAESVES